MFEHRLREIPGPTRQGSVAVLTILVLFVMFAFTALVVDIGYLVQARSQLQRNADAAAMAACWEYGYRVSKDEGATVAEREARLVAADFAYRNDVCRTSPYLSEDDMEFGYLADFEDRHAPLLTADPTLYNAVRLRVRKTSDWNGQVPHFFARIFGLQGANADAEAVAAIVRDVLGFEAPSDGSNLDILPFALDLETWNNMLDGVGSDDWTWDTKTGQITRGADGVLEMNLYPQGTGAPGNRGTVDIGSSNNSTNVIARQILEGITPSDLAYHGGTLKFNANGELALQGDTGISAGIQDELATIKGQSKVIPLFSQVQGPGNNADFTIVQWGGVRVMDVKLTGALQHKRVIVQTAPVITRGVIPSKTTGTSRYVYSPVVLVR